MPSIVACVIGAPYHFLPFLGCSRGFPALVTGMRYPIHRKEMADRLPFRDGLRLPEMGGNNLAILKADHARRNERKGRHTPPHPPQAVFYQRPREFGFPVKKAGDIRPTTLPRRHLPRHPAIDVIPRCAFFPRALIRPSTPRRAPGRGWGAVCCRALRVSAKGLMRETSLPLREFNLRAIRARRAQVSGCDIVACQDNLPVFAST